MKKSINIGIILFLLLQACSGEENSENQTALEKIPEDTPINSPQTSENIVENEIIEKEVQEEQLVQSQNNKNPFLNPEYADCLKDEFGEERFQQLQNERPTSEEEQRIARCMGPQGQGPEGQGPEESGEQTIERAIGVIQNATQEVLDCISNYFGKEVYKKVVDDLEPDEFEAGIVIQCKEEPQGSTTVSYTHLRAHETLR